MLTPRPYQTRALDELLAWFERHPDGNPIVEACVGAGKSMLIAMLARYAMTQFPGTRIIVIVPSKELLHQDVEELHNVWPEAKIGIYSAAVQKKQLGRDLTYATIGSIYKQAHKMGRVEIVMCDEAHLVNPKDAGMWRQFIADLRRYGNPHVRVVGLTGTAFRGNGVFLTAGEDPLFTGVATRVKMKELLDLGFLAPLTPAVTTARIDSSGVRTSGGDYVISDLARAADKVELVNSAADEITRLAADRKRWLVYAVTVEHAEHIRTALRDRGVAAELVTGNTPAAQRDAHIAAFRAGRVRCLVNIGVLTTGFSVKEVDFLALLRPTKSPVLYVQIMGRGMRIAPGKTDCLVADFTDTIELLGPVDEITGRLPTGGKAREGAPMKICPECGSQNPTAVAHCVDCGFKFPEPERINHGTRASGAAVLSVNQQAPQPVTVDDVIYRLHRGRDGKPDSVRVEYMAGLLPAAKEWVCLGHGGFARARAERWWSQRSRIDEIPADAQEAIEWLEFDSNILRRPSSIVVSKNGKYPEVVGYEW